MASNKPYTFYPFLLALVVVLMFASKAPVVDGSVIAIDFGTEWMEIAMIRGRSFDLVLNEQSNRKTATLLTWNQGNIIFGADARNLITKQPKSVYTGTFDLLGKKVDDPSFEHVKHFYPYKLEDVNGTFGVHVPDLNTTVPVETLVGLILNHAKNLATKYVGSQVKDCVITVPPYFTQHQRQAVIDAAKVGGLNVLSLLNQPSAIGINFGLERTFTENSTYAIFYDMGAAITTASLVSFKTISEKNKKQPTIQLTLHETAWDETLGGREFDRRLALYIVDQVKQQGGPDVTQDVNPRAFAKVMKEAQRAKEILSANQNVPLNIEGLVGEFDYRGEISRAAFEKLCEDLLERAVAPLQKVVEKSLTTVGSRDNIELLEVFGGGIRIPKVQQRLAEYWGKEVGKHINGDEGAALGAVFYAASQSPMFRAREFKLKDYSPYPVGLTVRSESGHVDKATELFKPYARYGSKKTVSFQSNFDDSLTVEYFYEDSNLLSPGTEKHLATYAVSGFSAEQYNISGTPKVNLKFRLNSNGIVVLENAEAEFTVVTYPQPAASSSGDVTENSTTTTAETAEDTSAKSDEKSTETTEETAAPTEENAESSQTTEESEEDDEKPTTSTKTPAKTTVSKGPSKRVHRVSLKITPIRIHSFSDADFKEASKILSDISHRAELKREKEKEKNTLEAYIYETREKLSTSEFESVTTEEQREEFSSKLNEAGDWLYDEGEDTLASAYRAKLRELKQLGDPIFLRVSEKTKRPETIATVLESINITKTIVANLTAMKEITEEEVQQFIKSCEDAEKWIEEKQQLAQAQAPHEVPIFTSDEVSQKWRDLEMRAKFLLMRPNKKPIKEKKIEIEDEIPSSSSSASEDASTESEGEQQTAENVQTEQRTETQDNGDAETTVDSTSDQPKESHDEL